MKTTHLIPLAALAQHAASQTYPYDPRTPSDCIAWADIDDATQTTCRATLEYWGMDPQRFRAWNPTVGLDCTPWLSQTSYCVLTNSTVADSVNATTLYGSNYPASGLVMPSLTTDSEGWRIPVTRTDASLYGFPTRAPIPEPGTWTDRGCFSASSESESDSESSSSAAQTEPWILEYRAPDDSASSSMSKCRSWCWEAQYPIAGMQNGEVCFCGEKINGSRVQDQGKCGFMCKEEEGVVCGGEEGFVSVWEAVGYVASASGTTVVSASASGASAATTATATTTTTTTTTTTASSGARRNVGMFWRVF